MSEHSWLNPIGHTESFINYVDGKNASTKAAQEAADVPAAPIPPAIGQAAQNIANMGLARATRTTGRDSTILSQGNLSMMQQVGNLLAQ